MVVVGRVGVPGQAGHHVRVGHQAHVGVRRQLLLRAAQQPRQPPRLPRTPEAARARGRHKVSKWWLAAHSWDMHSGVPSTAGTCTVVCPAGGTCMESALRGHPARRGHAAFRTQWRVGEGAACLYTRPRLCQSK